MNGDAVRIRTTNGDGVDVCDHVRIPGAFETADGGEYSVPIDIACDVCDESFVFLVSVN